MLQEEECLLSFLLLSPTFMNTNLRPLFPFPRQHFRLVMYTGLWVEGRGHVRSTLYSITLICKLGPSAWHFRIITLFFCLFGSRPHFPAGSFVIFFTWRMDGTSFVGRRFLLFLSILPTSLSISHAFVFLLYVYRASTVWSLSVFFYFDLIHGLLLLFLLCLCFLFLIQLPIRSFSFLNLRSTKNHRWKIKVI